MFGSQTGIVVGVQGSGLFCFSCRGHGRDDEQQLALQAGHLTKQGVSACQCRSILEYFGVLVMVCFPARLRSSCRLVGLVRCAEPDYCVGSAP